jgi:hypothetical protein
MRKPKEVHAIWANTVGISFKVKGHCDDSGGRNGRGTVAVLWVRKKQAR